MTQYIIAPEAIQDLKNITSYIAQSDFEAAEKFLNQRKNVVI